jgi:hypothetical protein
MQGIHQGHRRPIHKTAVTSAKRENCQQGPQEDPRNKSRKANSWVFRRTAENECQGSVDEPAPSKTKEETTDSLHAGAIGTQATFGSSAPPQRKKKWKYAHRLLFKCIFHHLNSVL